MIAASISISPIGAAVTPCASAKPTTSALPRPENSQNAGSRPLPAAQHREDRGRKRQKSDEHDRMRRRDVFSARAVSSGKPTTTPRAVMTSETISRALGPLLPEGNEHEDRQHGRDRGARHGEEDRIEIGDRGARRRQRGREDQHAEKSVDPADGDFVHAVLCGARPWILQRQKSTIGRNCTGITGPIQMDQFRSAAIAATRVEQVMRAIHDRIAARL